MAGAVANNVESHLPKGSTISVKPIGGGVGVIKLLQQGKADFGIGAPPSTAWAYSNSVLFEDGDAFKDLRVILGYLDTYWLPFGLRSDVPVNSFQELKQKQYPLKLAVAPAGSLGAVGVEQTLKAYGITFDDIESWGGSIKRMAFPDMPSAVQGGQVDGMSQVATPGHPTWQKASNSADMKYLAHTEKAKDYLMKRAWFDMPDIPKGMFGASQPVPTVGWRSQLVTTSALSKDVAKGLTKGIIEKQKSIANAYSGMEVFDPQKTGQQKYLKAPLHEGSKDYLTSKGYIE